VSHKRTASFLAMAALLVVAGVAAIDGPPPFRSASQFGEWMQNYYERPSPDSLLEALTYYSTSALFANAETRMPMAQFFASAYGEDSPRLSALVAALASNPSSNARMFAIRVLWLVNSDSSRSLIKQAAASWHDKNVQGLLSRIGDQRPRDLIREPVEQPVELDMLWSMFFATGDRQPIERLVLVLPLVKEGHGIEIAFGGAAQWSLKSNAGHHQRVLAILQALNQQATGTTKQLLEEIVAASDRKPLARPSPEPVPIGNPAGELAVHVVVSDSPDYIREWVATAPSNPVFVHHLQSMQRGSTAYIAFVVSGYKLDSPSRANLEVAFTIRKPDGTVLVTRPGYAKFALVAAEHAFVMADPALDFATDQSDTLGTYRIEAVVTDKFANLNATSVAMLEVVR